MTATDDPQQSLSRSDGHRLLSSSRRQTLLRVLDARSTPIGLRDLATAVARRERDEAIDDAVQRVAIDLHHSQLPMLREYGVVEYDTEATRIVEYRPVDRFATAE